MCFAFYRESYINIEVIYYNVDTHSIKYFFLNKEKKPEEYEFMLCIN